MLEKIVGASRAPVAARQHREAQRAARMRSSHHHCPPNSSTAAAMTSTVLNCSSWKATRPLAQQTGQEPEFQALLPIRGKILNVQKASIGDMLKNAECGSIIQVVGAGSGRSFDLEAARYGKIIFMADADSDGAHILFAGDVVLPVHAPAGGCRAGLHGGAAVASLRASRMPARGRRSTSTPIPTLSTTEGSRAHQAGSALQGAAALQGSRRDGRRSAGRDDDESPAPHSAPDDS